MKSGEDKGGGRVIRVQTDKLSKATSGWQWISSTPNHAHTEGAMSSSCSITTYPDLAAAIWAFSICCQLEEGFGS